MTANRWETTMDAADVRRLEAAANALVAEGGGPGNSIHSWRCEYPERYGACGCAMELARSMLAAADAV